MMIIIIVSSAITLKLYTLEATFALDPMPHAPQNICVATQQHPLAFAKVSKPKARVKVDKPFTTLQKPHVMRPQSRHITTL